MNLKLRKSDKLRPCPFCGSNDLELNNTHSASYWISCACGAEMHGKDFDGKSRPAHREAVKSAVNRWNKTLLSRE